MPPRLTCGTGCCCLAANERHLMGSAAAPVFTTRPATSPLPFRTDRMTVDVRLVANGSFRWSVSGPVWQLFIHSAKTHRHRHFHSSVAAVRKQLTRFPAFPGPAPRVMVHKSSVRVAGGSSILSLRAGLREPFRH